MNLAFYYVTPVSSVSGVDRSEGLLAKAAAAPQSAGLRVEALNGTSEFLPFNDADFDTVLGTFTLPDRHSRQVALHALPVLRELKITLRRQSR